MLNSSILLLLLSNVSIFLGSLLLCIFIWSLMSRDREKDLLSIIPGPTPLPILGNSLLFAGPSESVWLPTFKSLRLTYGPVVRLRFGYETVILISSPENVEQILNSSKHISKGFTYRFFWPWLGQGLLTSTGSHWKSHRKLLTPAFHFRILEDFLQVMNEQAQVLCGKLTPHGDGNLVDLYPFVTHCALDIICETAMGRKIDAQADCNSSYIKSVYESQALIFHRMTSPWLWNDFLHGISSCGRNLNKCLAITHGFTEKVIRERKIEVNAKLEKTTIAEDDIGIKKKLSFLDLLISASKDGRDLTDQDIREEVDTFMFEGHDTTASNISLTLYLFSCHPEVQAKCHRELDEIFGNSCRPATSADLNEMKYLHCCLKESLRLYGSVPSIGRRTAEKIELGGFVIPANTNIQLNIALIHRDPGSFPQPEKFDPERFSAENERSRHPYSYIPFSAGPRNCIGQKFAVMEEKAVISRVLRSFHLSAHTPIEEVPLLPELVLKPRDGLFVKLQPRDGGENCHLQSPEEFQT